MADRGQYGGRGRGPGSYGRDGGRGGHGSGGGGRPWYGHRRGGGHGGVNGGGGHGGWGGRHGGGGGGGGGGRYGGVDGDIDGQGQAGPGPGSGFGSGPGSGSGAGTGDCQLDFSPPPCAASLPPRLRAAVDAYMGRFAPLVQMELDEERRQVDERLRSWPLPRLRSEGLVLTELRAARRGSYLGKTIIRLTAQDGGELPFHRFTSGTLVTLCRRSPLAERASEALVLDRARWEVRLVAERPPRDLNEGLWRLDKGANITTYQRMAQALQALYKVPPQGEPGAAAAASAAGAAAAAGGAGEGSDEEDEDYGEDDAGGGYGRYGGGGGGRRRGRGRGGGGGRGHKRRRRQQEEEDADLLPPGTHLADVLLAGVGPGPGPAEGGATGVPAAAAAGTAAAAAAASLPAPRVPAAAVRWAGGHAGQPADPRAEHPELGLNASQVSALALALRHRLVLLQGPPGTGKTTTIVRFIRLLKQEFGYPGPILAVAQSNVAVDNLLEGLVDLGVRAVRVGQPVKVRESLRDATLDARILEHPAREAIEAQQEELRELYRRLPSLRGRDRGLGHRDASLAARRLREARAAMMADILQGADVICSTCVGAGGDTLQDLSFGLVVLDEGSQCCEPEALIPLVKGCHHAVLVGDHCQLPPVVVSEEAARGGLAVSLFARLMEAGLPAAMLQVQYRMHPCLSAFPSARFYGDRLLDGVGPHQRPAPPLPLPAPQAAGPLMFVDVAEGREEVSQGGSKSNRAEARVVAGLVRHMVGAGVGPGDIGIVTPYVAQVQLLSALLQPLVPAAGPALEVSSVDGYQGREKEIMIFSTVRANPSASIGFLEDWRRLNVAITRPRRALILVGHADTLRRGDAMATATGGRGVGLAGGSGASDVASGGHWAAYMRWLESLPGGVVVRGEAGLARLGWRLG